MRIKITITYGYPETIDNKQLHLKGYNQLAFSSKKKFTEKDKMISAGKITIIYIISIIYNLLIPLILMLIIYGNCKGECLLYPISMFLFSIFFYLTYYFLQNEKVENNKRLKLLIFFIPSILFLITSTSFTTDFNDFIEYGGALMIPNLILNFLYYKKLG